MKHIHEFSKHFFVHSEDYKLGGVTLRVWLDKETDEYYMAWSVCSPEDNFSRKVGNAICKANYFKGIVVKGKRDYALSIEMDLLNTLNSGELVTSSERTEYYRKQAIQTINFVFLVESLQELAVIRETPVVEDRNSLIDRIMSYIPFFTANSPIR